MADEAPEVFGPLKTLRNALILVTGHLERVFYSGVSDERKRVLETTAKMHVEDPERCFLVFGLEHSERLAWAYLLTPAGEVLLRFSLELLESAAFFMPGRLKKPAGVTHFVRVSLVGGASCSLHSVATKPDKVCRNASVYYAMSDVFKLASALVPDDLRALTYIVWCYSGSGDAVDARSSDEELMARFAANERVLGARMKRSERKVEMQSSSGTTTQFDRRFTVVTQRASNSYRRAETAAE